MKKNNNFDGNSPVHVRIEKQRLEKYGVSNWTKTDEGRKIISSQVTEEWKKAKESLEKEECYSLEETVQLLRDGDYWKKFTGKAKNRTLLKTNPKLFKSVYRYSESLEKTMKEESRYASSYNFPHRLMFLVEKEGNVENLRCSCGRTYSWTGRCRHCSETKNTFAGLSQEQKDLRIIKRRLKLGDKMISEGRVPPYNPESIVILDSISRENGWNLQHALNGGEVRVEGLGYWLDAYDREKNVVVEIDEPRHFSDFILQPRDIKRQKEIEAALHCSFYRYYFNKLTGSVILYHTPSHDNWDFRNGIQLSEELGLKKNNTKFYKQYGV